MLSSPLNAAPSPSSAPKPLSLGVIFLTLYIDLIGFSIFFPLGPALLEYYVKHESRGGLFGSLVNHLQGLAHAAHASDLATGALFAGALGSLYSLMQFLFSPIWGSYSDRLGRRRVLLLTIAGNAFSYLMFFFSGSFTLFLLSRLLGGIMGGNLAVAVAAVSDVTSRENRAKGMGIVGVAFGLGFLTGPVIGGLTAHLNLLDRWPGLAALGVHPFSVPAAIAFGLCLINLIWSTARFQETLPPGRRGAVHSVRERNPLHALFRQPDPGIRRSNVICFVLTFGFSFFESIISFFTADALHYTPRDLTLIFITLGLVSIFTQGFLARRYVHAIGERRAAIGGMTLVALGFAGIGLAVGVFRSAPLLYAALTLNAVGSGFANISLSALISLYAKPEEQGKVIGIYRSLSFLARALSPAVAGLLFFNSGGTVTFATASVILAVAALLGLGLPPPHR
ncbi:MAG: MFS transporter [Opitutae bacterium]|nr:MFS transporter [Opitutae bacterium]